MANSDKAEPDDAAATALILGEDTSSAGWKRRAVRTTRDKALSEVPMVGQLMCQIPIEPLREIQTHIRGHNVNQARWVRQAIVNQYLREGGDPDIAEAAMKMRQDVRRRDVPRDWYGQPRSRMGRKGG